MRKRLFFLLFAITLFITGCNTSTSDKVDDELFIYTSIYPIQYVTEQITLDLANVESIFPPGVDAHTYEPTSKEITSLANGDAFIYLGAGMEGFAESARDALHAQDILFIELGEHEELFETTDNHDEHDGHDHGDYDPHIWLDPLRMIEMGEIIKDALTSIHPEYEQDFSKNLEKLKENMIDLDDRFTETLQPKKNKEIIVTHSAYGYWESSYGIEQIAISGLSSSDEPSQRELVTISKQAKALDIGYVIFEQNSSNRVATIIQEYIGADELYIHNLETLTEDDIENKEDYLSLMERNLQTLDQATN